MWAGQKLFRGKRLIGFGCITFCEVTMIRMMAVMMMALSICFLVVMADREDEKRAITVGWGYIVYYYVRDTWGTMKKHAPKQVFLAVCKT